MLWDISRQRTSAERWCTSNSAVFWVQPVLIFLIPPFLHYSMGPGGTLLRTLVKQKGEAILCTGLVSEANDVHMYIMCTWCTSACTPDDTSGVSSSWWGKSLPALPLCLWLSSNVTVRGQWAVLVEKGRQCEYLGHLCTQSCGGGLRSCLEYLIFLARTYEREVLHDLLSLSFHVVSAWLSFCSGLGYGVTADLTDGKTVWLIFVKLILCGF